MWPLNLKIEKETLLRGASQYGLGVLGGATVILLFKLFSNSTPMLGTVNITGMVERFIKTESQLSRSPDVLKKEVSQFGVTLDETVKAFSKQHHVMLFVREAAVSGVPDYSDTILKQLNNRLHQGEHS